MTSFVRRVVAVLAVGAAPSFLHATWTLSITCQGTSACGAISNPPQTAGTFNTQSECEAAKGGFACAVLACSPGCSPCSVTNTIKVCSENGGGSGGGGGGGGGASLPPASLPGSAFLPGGSLLGNSQFDNIAGGFHGFGDSSLLGSEYGDASFSPHYTDSTDLWLKETTNRLYAECIATMKQHGVDTIACGSPYGEGPAPDSTKSYEMAYAAEIGSGDGGNFLEKLQMRQTGTGMSAGPMYMTSDELLRQRLKAQGDSMVMTGTPIELPETPEVSAPSDGSMLDWLKEKGENFLEEKLVGWAGITEAWDRVSEAGGIVNAAANRISEAGFSAATEGAAALATGTPAQIGAVEQRLNDRVNGIAEDTEGQVNDFVVGQFKDAASGAVGELVDVEIAPPGFQQTWDVTVAAAEKSYEAVKKSEEKLREIVARGGDASAIGHVVFDTIKEEAPSVFNALVSIGSHATKIDEETISEEASAQFEHFMKNTDIGVKIGKGFDAVVDVMLPIKKIEAPGPIYQGKHPDEFRLPEKWKPPEKKP